MTTEAPPEPEVVPEWEVMQCKTFTKWCNIYLGKRDMSISNIQTVCAAGIAALRAVQLVSGCRRSSVRASGESWRPV